MTRYWFSLPRKFGRKSYKESYIDNNNNNKYDSPEKAGDYKFNYLCEVFSEPFIDVPNGRYDIGEKYNDLNSDGYWTPADIYSRIGAGIGFCIGISK